MTYFVLKQDKCVVKPPRFKNVDKEIFTCDNNESVVVHLEENDNYEFVDFITNPKIIVGEDPKKVFSMYNDSMEIKYIYAMSPLNKKNNKSYYICRYPKINCLHKDSIILDTGEVRKIVLDSKKINDDDNPFFLVKEVGYEILIASLEVVESLLRRNIFGMEIEEVEMR